MLIGYDVNEHITFKARAECLLYFICEEGINIRGTPQAAIKALGLIRLLRKLGPRHEDAHQQNRLPNISNHRSYIIPHHLKNCLA